MPDEPAPSPAAPTATPTTTPKPRRSWTGFLLKLAIATVILFVGALLLGHKWFLKSYLVNQIRRAGYSGIDLTVDSVTWDTITLKNLTIGSPDQVAVEEVKFSIRNGLLSELLPAGLRKKLEIQDPDRLIEASNLHYAYASKPFRWTAQNLIDYTDQTLGQIAEFGTWKTRTEIGGIDLYLPDYDARIKTDFSGRYRYFEIGSLPFPKELPQSLVFRTPPLKVPSQYYYCASGWFNPVTHPASWDCGIFKHSKGHCLGLEVIDFGDFDTRGFFPKGVSLQELKSIGKLTAFLAKRNTSLFSGNLNAGLITDPSSLSAALSGQTEIFLKHPAYDEFLSIQTGDVSGQATLSASENGTGMLNATIQLEIDLIRKQNKQALPDNTDQGAAFTLTINANNQTTLFTEKPQPFFIAGAFSSRKKIAATNDAGDPTAIVAPHGTYVYQDDALAVTVEWPLVAEETGDVSAGIVRADAGFTWGNSGGDDNADSVSDADSGFRGSITVTSTPIDLGAGKLILPFPCALLQNIHLGGELWVRPSILAIEESGVRGTVGIELGKGSFENRTWDLGAEGISGTTEIRIDANTVTAERQTLSVARLRSAEMEFTNGLIHYSVLASGVIHIHDATFEFLGGQVTLLDAAIDPALGYVDLQLLFDKLSLKKVAAWLAPERFAAEGSLSGAWRWRVRWSPEADLELGEGKLFAVPSTGWLNVLREEDRTLLLGKASAQLGDFAELQVKLETALQDFLYESLAIDFGVGAEALKAAINLSGKGPRAVKKPIPIGGLTINVRGLADLLKLKLFRSRNWQGAIQKRVGSAVRKVIEKQHKQEPTSAEQHAIDKWFGIDENTDATADAEQNAIDAFFGLPDEGSSNDSGQIETEPDAEKEQHAIETYFGL